MLKFVSTKPPKGKHEAQQEVHNKQARGNFRLKAAPEKGSLHYFDRGENVYDSDRSLEIYGREKNLGNLDYDSGIYGYDEAVYDNIAGVKFIPSEAEKVNVSQKEMEYSRSRTPSASSVDSSRGSLRKYPYDSAESRKAGHYRHVRWSPEVINGDRDQKVLTNNSNKSSKKGRSISKAGKKSLQGISKFLLGDSHGKKQNKPEVDNDSILKSPDVTCNSSHVIQNQAVQNGVTEMSGASQDKMKYVEHDGCRLPSIQREEILGSNVNRPNQQHSSVSASEDYYDNSVETNHQRIPRGRDQNSHGMQKFVSMPALWTLSPSGVTNRFPTYPSSQYQGSSLIFSPIYSSTPKRSHLRRSEDGNLIDSGTRSVPRNVKESVSKNRIFKDPEISSNVVSVGSTWQHRPYSLDYEEINPSSHMTGSQRDIDKNGSQESHDLNDSISSSSSDKVRRHQYPRLHFPRPYEKLKIASPTYPKKNNEKTTEESQNVEQLYSKVNLNKEKSKNYKENCTFTDKQAGGTEDSWSTVSSLRDSHEKDKVMTSCVPQINHEVNKHETVNKYHVTREIPISGPATQRPGMSSLHDMMSRSHGQPMDGDQVTLDLVYITERIMSMSFASDAQDSKYQFNLHEVMDMLKKKHGENILILNLSEPRDDLQKANNQRVIDYGWPDHLAPPLERMCNICKSLDSWLNSDPNHVTVLHCKGGQGRVALIIAAFMHYSSICASADQALDKFAMKRFLDEKLGGLSYPSHKRYVQYFSGLLSGAIKINSNPLYLHHLVIHGVPNFDAKGGCRPFIKVYQGMQPIFTSGVYHVTDQMQKVCISISPGIPLRGDIMIKCYHKKIKTGQREPIWRCQFHTCAISDYSLIFSKMELDDAVNDPRFPVSGKTEFVFGPNQDANVPVSDFKSDVTVPVDDNTDGLVRWDSYENFAHVDGTSSTDDRNSNRHTVKLIQREEYATGPKDGSLYATVNKKHDYHITETTVIRNGTSPHVNGSLSPHASSDSGISGTSGNIGGTTSPSMSPPYQVNTSDSRHYGTNERQHQTSYSSSMNRDNVTMHNSTSSPPSTVSKQTLLDEQAKLDNILSDLFSDHVSMSSPSKSGSSTMSKETRTFRTFETQKGPDGKPLHQSAEVTYKLPEERHYTVKTEKSSYTQPNAFRYTPTSPEMARKMENPKTSTLPYRTDYDNRFSSENSYSYNTLNNSRTMSESDSSWLEQQQRKLREKKDVKDEKRVQQEKKFVEELRTAQNKYMTKRQKSEEDERKVMDSYQPPVMNGPTSPGNYNYTVTRTHTYSTDKSPGAYSTGTFDRSSTKTVERKETVEQDSNRLTELEKSLQAASNSIIASQQPWQQQRTTTTGPQGFTQEHVVTRRVETRKYETHQQQQQQQQHQQAVSYGDGPRSASPVWDNVTSHVSVTQIQPPSSPPRQIKTVEEDRFSLRPIGPGVQTLEPEGVSSSTGTLNRATTPSFPVSPVASAATPPFPVSPRTPYFNQGTTQQVTQKQYNTQQQQQHQQHYQYQYNTSQQQQQQHQQHQYHTDSMSQNGGTLHVDTSPKMLATGSSGTMRSPSSVGSPHSPESLHNLRQQLHVAHSSSGAIGTGPHSMTGQSSPSVYFGLSRRGSLSSIADAVDATHTTPRFVKDTSKYWYKPQITREDAIALLKDKAPGTFVVRDSNSFPGAFGLALKVATIPPNVQTKSTGDPAADLVRHFLIEPTPKGVRLRGCSNEPVFGSLASLVYQHSITPLALPCKLALPDVDTSGDTSTMDSSITSEVPSSAAALLAQGAACNVMYLNSVDTESLTGPQAVSKAIMQTFDQVQQAKQTVVHFKVSNQGITLTDNQRKLFFRRHYPVSAVTYCGMDPEGRKWSRETDVPGVRVEARIFGFVARKQGGVSDNACHLFAELDPEQPASAIVNFVTKIMIGQGKVKS